MTRTCDAILIGGGHNGLTTAAFLAKAGLDVLVLERREVLGGAAATETIFPGFKVNTGAAGAPRLLPAVVKGLKLDRFGLEFIESPVQFFAPLQDGRALTIWCDTPKTVASIRAFSPQDAIRYPEYLAFMDRMAGILREVLTLTPPDVEGRLSLRDLFPWAKVALKVRGLGEQDMMEFLRVLPMGAWEFLNEWFESPVVKGALGMPGIMGSMQGPRAAGTALMLLYRHTGSPGGGFIRGGVGRLSEALAAAARHFGAEIKTGVAVKRILVAGRKAVGVELSNGEQIHAQKVVSSADPRHTFFDLVGAPHLPVYFNRRVKNIRFRGSTAALHLALGALPSLTGFPEGRDHLTGHILINADLDTLERAYDDAKYGRYSQQPALDLVIPTLLDPSLAPPGQHILSVTMRYAPYALRVGHWARQREALASHLLDTLSKYLPDLKEVILHRRLITPLDWEQEYGLPEGSIFHGQMDLDQLVFMRPVGGWARYRTPIEHLYLCGAGAHPGGGVTGAPGFNAAREILRD